jgi:hypothetical protein
MKDVIKGTKTIGDIVEKYDGGKENLKRVGNKVVQSLGPAIKIPTEMIMGEKMFPSVWNRQPITDNLRYVAENFGLQSAYDKIAGKPIPKDLFKKELIKTMVYKEDLNRFGWLAIQQKISAYQKKHKLKGTGFIVTETGNSLYNIGLAVRYGDIEAANKYLTLYVQQYVSKAYKAKDFTSTMSDQWEKLKPLAALPNKTHRDLFMASLDERGAYQLMLAYKYYAEIASGKQFMQGKGTKTP